MLPAQAAPSPATGEQRLLQYLEALARPDGGYGWAGQDRSHLTPTYAVVGCYQQLGQKPPHAERLAEFIRTHHPFALKTLEHRLPVFEYQ